MGGPAPQSFLKWLRSVGKGGAIKKLRVFCDGGEKLVAMRSAIATQKLIEDMGPSSCEALDKDGTILSEWTFVEVNDDAKDEEPGYDLKEGDNDQVRMLKTFAHLLADAHKVAVQRVVDVVKIQSDSFNEERKAMVGLRMANERMTAQLDKLRASELRRRLRIATDEEDQPEEGNDDFLQSVIAPIIAKNLSKMGIAPDEEPEHTNGVKKE